MTIRLTCAECQRKLKVPDEALGKKVQCPVCGARFLGRLEPTPRSEPAPFPNLALDEPAALEPIAEEAISVDENEMLVTEAVNEAETMEPEVVDADEAADKGKTRPKKKSRKLLWGCLSAIGLVLLIGCGGGGFFAYRFWTGYISDDDWKPFIPPNGFCNISMPGDPEATVDNSQPGLELRRYAVDKTSARAQFQIVICDLPAAANNSNTLAEMLKAEVAAIPSKYNPTPQGETPVTLGAYQGREARVQLAAGRTCIIRIFLVPRGTQTRMYELVALGPNIDANTGAGAKFFNSFTIVSAPSNPPQPGGAQPPRPQPQPRPRPRR